MNDFRLFRLYQKIKVIMFTFFVSIFLFGITILSDFLLSSIILKYGTGEYSCWKLILMLPIQYCAVVILGAYTTRLIHILKCEREFFHS